MLTSEASRATMRTVLPTVFGELEDGVDVDVGCEEDEEASEEVGEEEEVAELGGQAHVEASPRAGDAQAATVTSRDQRITTFFCYGSL